MKKHNYLFPNWPAPSNIRAWSTTRTGGTSPSPYGSFNLAHHVGDDPSHVQANRDILALDLPSEPCWLNQTHTTRAVMATQSSENADASYSSEAGKVCIVMVADCLPILLCNREGTEVAAIHAGWRGLCGGIIENTVNALQSPPNTLLAWLAPAISQPAYEVGDEVYEAFITAHSENSVAFMRNTNRRWQADLYELARLTLRRLGIEAIYGGEHCTYRENTLFYSYRRDAGRTGRMATLIYKVE